MLVLVINSGSSSIKYQVRQVPSGADSRDAGAGEEILTKGLIESIGQEGAVADHSEALDLLAGRLDGELDGREIDVVGHRVVHGGERFSEPVLIDNEIVRAIERLAPLAPLHNPAAALGIRAIQKKWPHMPQVAVFDTAFHRTLPEHAWRYAIPDELYRLHGIRRYGFHGTSHDYVTGRAAEHLGVPREDFDGIVAHLGNGASVTAIKGGASVDTSMGYTPLAGLVMGTRSGDVDPSVLTALMDGPDGYDAERMDRVLNNESGLLAIGGTNDMRELVDLAENGDEKALLALRMAAYRLTKYIGGYHVVVGGAETLIFTAGIGENSAPFRRMVLEGLGALGVTLDEEANEVRSDEVREISGPDSAITVLVVPTDEERAIAEASVGVLEDRG
ncbi:acetate/propionate family kinase [Rothia halotolerans]|uniref:acetate/propionate family kinase n=1 Tax=Rothia halotolerans TaxID=405770 RepID=UPI00101C67CB|nr:acetate kinase [Rothia halotolerans]